MSIDPVMATFIGVFFGILARTAVPYLKRLREAKEAGKALPFDPDYLWTALGSLALCVIATLLIFPQVNVVGFLNGFTFGFTTNAIINEIVG